MEKKDLQEALAEGLKPVAEEVKGAKSAAEEAKTAANSAKTTADTIKTEVDGLKTWQAQADEAAKKNRDDINILLTKSNRPEIQTKGSFDEVLTKALKEKEDELKTLSEKGGTNVRFQVKAVAPISLSSFGTGVLRGYDEPGITGKPYNPRFIMGLISVMNGGPGSNPISWVERIPKEGGPAWTLELATKPGMDFTLVRNSAEAQYLAVTTEVTKQALLSMPVLQQEIYDLLNNELNNKLEQDIITGSGVAPIIKGIQTYATAFAAGSLAGTIQDPNEFDVLRAAIGRVLKANFFPNAILVSIDKATSMDLTKGSDGHYVLPPFTTAEGTVIKGVRVYATNFVGDDDFIVGDMTRYLFNIVEGLTIDVGYINDQFVKNLATVRAELFGMGRVKNQEALAFVKGTFTAAKAALAIPAP